MNYVVRVRHVFTWLVVAHRCWELGLVVGVGVSGWVGCRKERVGEVGVSIGNR